MSKGGKTTRGGCLLMMIILAIALLTVGFGIWMLVEEPKPTPVRALDPNYRPAHPVHEPAR